MMLHSRRAVDACGVTGLLLLVALAYLGVWEPARRAGAAASMSVQRNESTRERLAEINQALERATLRLSAARSELETMPRLDSVRKLNARLRMIGELAESHGVRIAEVIPGEPIVRDKLASVPIRLSGQATYVQFSGFLAALHASMPDVAVEKLRIQAVRTGGGSDSFTLEVVWNALRDQDGSPSSVR